MSFEENVKHIDDLDDKKLSPLHYAARYSNIEILKTLIHYGANPNRAGDDEMTPLHYSARLLKSCLLTFSAFCLLFEAVCLHFQLFVCVLTAVFINAGTVA